MRLERGHKQSQNLELLLDAADFTKLFVMEDFKHYELHKAVECKKKKKKRLDSDQ